MKQTQGSAVLFFAAFLGIAAATFDERFYFDTDPPPPPPDVLTIGPLWMGDNYWCTASQEDGGYGPDFNGRHCIVRKI